VKEIEKHKRLVHKRRIKRKKDEERENHKVMIDAMKRGNPAAMGGMYPMMPAYGMYPPGMLMPPAGPPADQSGNPYAAAGGLR